MGDRSSLTERLSRSQWPSSGPIPLVKPAIPIVAGQPATTVHRAFRSTAVAMSFGDTDSECGNAWGNRYQVSVKEAD